MGKNAQRRRARNEASRVGPRRHPPAGLTVYFGQGPDDIDWLLLDFPSPDEKLEFSPHVRSLHVTGGLAAIREPLRSRLTQYLLAQGVDPVAG